MNLITIDKARELTRKNNENLKLMHDVSKRIENAAKRGIDNFIDIECSSPRDEYRELVIAYFKGFKIDEIKSHQIDDDPFHGKTYKHSFRIWW